MLWKNLTDIIVFVIIVFEKEKTKEVNMNTVKLINILGDNL